MSEVFRGYAAYEKGGEIKPFEYVPRPLGPNDVEIKISHCGICHSDLHTLDSGWGPTIYPVIVGHEVVGTIEKVGSEVQSLKVGQRVGVGAQVYSCQKFSCDNCRHDHDNHCPKIVFTYNSQYEDLGLAYGGYQERVRVDAAYAFVLPDNLPSAAAAPILCAGTTVYSPLARWGAGSSRKNVGVVGLGGLGHFALKYAVAMGATVTVISTSENKRADALRLGATHFVIASDEKEVQKYQNSLDLVINCVSDLPNLGAVFNLMKMDSVFVQVGAPENNLSVPPFVFISKRIIFTGSLIGSRKEITETLEFSGKHNITADIQILPMSEVNKGVQLVRDNKPRYRIVLEN